MVGQWLMYELEQPAGEKTVKCAVAGERSRTHRPAEVAPDHQGVSAKKGQDVHHFHQCFHGNTAGQSLAPT